jgi:predicted ATPase
MRDVLVDAVRGRELLLVLDNFEQVLPAATDVDMLLRACPRLTVLVTSRAALQLRGEHETPVPPLSLPPAGQPTAPESLTQYAAVALFVDRATALQPDFRVTDENAPAVAEICTRLDGLPLAIELAAARTRVLPPRAMLDRLEPRLALLTGGPRDLPARQQTLRATIAWSYDLLTEPERRLFERLGVFVGGFTLGAGSWVMGDGGSPDALLAPNTHHPSPITLDLVSALVSRSLLRQQEQPDGEPRFSMLETIREYALERLEMRGEAAEARRRHAQHFMALAEEAEPWLTRSQAGLWMDRLELDQDNLRAALVWSDSVSEANALARMAVRLWYFWYLRGHFDDAERWIGRALDRATEPETRLDLLIAAANLAFFQDDAATSIRMWSEAIELGRAHGNQRAVARSLARRGFMLRNIGEMERAVADADEALAIARRLDDSWLLGHVLHGFAQVARAKGDVDAAEAAWSEALARFREVDEAYMVAHMVNNLGSVALQRGELDNAMRLCTEGLALIRQRDDRFALRPALVNLLRIAHRLGDEERALAMAREVVTLGARQGSPVVVAHALDGIAWVATRRGSPGRAARLLGAARELRRAAGYADRPEQLPLQHDAEALARAALGEETYTTIRADGEAMTLEQAATDALEETGSP